MRRDGEKNRWDYLRAIISICFIPINRVHKQNFVMIIHYNSYSIEWNANDVYIFQVTTHSVTVCIKLKAVQQRLENIYLLQSFSSIREIDFNNSQNGQRLNAMEKFAFFNNLIPMDFGLCKSVEERFNFIVAFSVCVNYKCL